MDDSRTLADRLAAAQGEVGNVPLDGTNPHFRSRFATLGACLRVVRPALSRHGIAVVQMPGTVEGGVSVTTALLCRGERLESTVSCACGSEPQKMGSAITYLRRYALCAMVGVVGDDDDDGEQATGPVSATPDDRLFREQQEAARAILRDLGARTQADANRIVQEATDGTLSLRDLDEHPGDVLAAIREWRDLRAAADQQEQA